MNSYLFLGLPSAVFRVSSRESSLRFSTWLGQTMASLMIPLIFWILWLWYGPNGLDRTIPWWYIAGAVAVVLIM